MGKSPDTIDDRMLVAVPNSDKTNPASDVTSPNARLPSDRRTATIKLVSCGDMAAMAAALKRASKVATLAPATIAAPSVDAMYATGRAEIKVATAVP